MPKTLQLSYPWILSFLLVSNALGCAPEPDRTLPIAPQNNARPAAPVGVNEPAFVHVEFARLEIPAPPAPVLPPPPSGVQAAAYSAPHPIGEPGTISREETAALLLGYGLRPDLLPAALHIIGLESTFSPGAIGDTCAKLCLGLGQLDEGTWPAYCQMSREELLTRDGGARCFVLVVEYDLATYDHDPWRQWPNTRP